jgi:hypothetical protein
MRRRIIIIGSYQYVRTKKKGTYTILYSLTLSLKARAKREHTCIFFLRLIAARIK